MNILGGSAEEHLEKFICKLELYFPNIREYRILWFDKFDLIYQEGSPFLEKKRIKTLEKLPEKLNELSSEGKSWINIYGEGIIEESVYLLSIEYDSSSSGAKATSINATGPFLNLNKEAKIKAKLKII